MKAQRKSDFASRAQLAEEKKLAIAACKVEALAKRKEKQEQKIATAFSRPETATLKAGTLCSQLAKIEATAPSAKQAYSQKRVKGASSVSAPNFSPTTAAPACSPSCEPMSTKKRVSMQSPPCSQLQHKDALSLSSLEEAFDLTLALLSSSGYSSTFSVVLDGSKRSPLAAGGLSHPASSRGHPARGHGGLHYSAPGCVRSFLNYP